MAEPFRIAIDQAAIDDLKARLTNTRWAPDPGNTDWAVGVNGDYLRGLMAYWRDGFDWRAQEAKLNRFPHFRTPIDGAPIHFIHQRGKGPKPIPLILSHGWPWTFFDFAEIIDLLADPVAHGGDAADAFDVVVPSLPGTCFSSPLGERRIGYEQTADLWLRLMRDVLGYDRFGAHGGDSGAYVSSRLGYAHPAHLTGVHLNFPVLPGVSFATLSREMYAPDEVHFYDQRDKTGQHYTHLLVHTLEPQTISYAMHDSPVGQAAWHLHRRRAWSDCNGDVESRFDRDTLLTHFSLIWFTESFGGSVRFYRESDFRQPLKLDQPGPAALTVPTGIAVFPRELVHLSRALAARHCDLRRWTVMPSGGMHL
jgi:hypothetical protein